MKYDKILPLLIEFNFLLYHGSQSHVCYKKMSITCILSLYDISATPII